MMKQWHILGAAVLPLWIGGCAASQDHGRTAAVYHTSTQQQAADLAREFRSQSQLGPRAACRGRRGGQERA